MNASGSPNALRRSIRVLHVIPSLYGGGMERGLVALVTRRALPAGRATERTIEHGVCVLRSGDEDLVSQCGSTAATWTLGAHGDRGASRDWGCALRLRRVVRRFRPDVVHARSTGVWLDSAAATIGFRGVRLLLAFHGRTDLAPAPWRHRLRNRWAARLSDAVLSVSEHAAGMMRTEWGVPRNRIVVIPDGVDTERFRPARSPQEALLARRQLGLPDATFVAVAVANLVPIKAIDALIRAWRLVILRNPRVVLLVVGDGPLRRDLERLTDTLRCHGHVRFLGRREDVPDVLRAADLFVLSSLYEGTSNAVQEAMATGLPVVATDVGGMRELLTHERTGWLVEAGSPEAMAERILRVIADEPARRRAGDAARADAERRFAFDTWVDRYTALYQRLASAPEVSPSPSRPLSPSACFADEAEGEMRSGEEGEIEIREGGPACAG